MKFALVTVLALLAVTSARNIGVDPEDLTAYNYLERFGLPLAEEIRKYEEENQMSRIVGGSASSSGQFPYQAGLLATFSGGTGVCGGSLLNSNRVLTAAHCWWDGRNQATMFTVVLGSTTLFSGGNRQNTNQITMHAQWLPNVIRNDVAMIRINAVSFNNLISPIALPSGAQLNNDFVGWTATASGFGRTADGANGAITTAQTLRHVQLPVITNAVCWTSFPLNVVASNICTSGAGARSTCNGDSGGPLAVTVNGQPLLIGVVSFGSIHGCQLGHPAAFARVTSFNAWIRALL